MRRILSICITLILFFSVIPLNGNYPTIALAKNEGNKNQPATFAAKKFHRIGFDRDGNPTKNGTFFPWEFTRGSSWGRKEVTMPNGPAFWFEWYLTIDPDGGKSKPENKWYGVIDSAGRMWLDPDGNFHNSNYDQLSDPTHPAYVAGRCENNPRGQVDPLSNTQGPYVLNPNDPDYKPEIYFYDRLITGRAWRIGWVDLVDFYASGTTKPDGTISDGIVVTGDWDLDLPLVRFINGALEVTLPDPVTLVPTLYPYAVSGEEWHSESIEQK